MPTCRVLIADALRAVKTIAPGDMAHVDQLTTGLEALQNLIVELHEARGPLLDVDITASTWTPSEDQRIRVQLGDTATITLPNAVPIYGTWDPYDYGFSGEPPMPAQGTTGSADQITWRQPADGARIELVGTTQQLYFYRADINTWMPAYGLTLDTESPLNQRLSGSLAVLIAERLMEVWAVDEPTPGFAARATRARTLIFTRPGTRREPVRADYF